MAVQLPRRRFTVAEDHKLAAAGILSEDERVALIEAGGWGWVQAWVHR
ncbi:MAG: hypothetical protein KatS3mg131_1953 [Candidatus Tectimicrobiota bacterium]|nr:MAG: hypothetical protein KatS3mg131_1953 [Candidatus Tectomicrobia bacterium]